LSPSDLSALNAPGPGGSSLSQVSPAGPMGRTGVDNWTRPQATSHERVEPDEDALNPQGARGAYGEEPAYGPVLGFTAGWYAIPATLYLIWLATLNSDRQGLVGRAFVGSLPWLFGAMALSLTVAALLRWATVGWRTLTLSFAAAVIGGGVATIAHSLVL
jgi:hypothetical protein